MTDPNNEATPNDPSSAINITGGEIQARDIVGGDKIIHGDEVQTKIVVTAEQAYDVRGLANPYLGLAAFTYADRAKYAGREKLVAETLARTTTPGAAIPLLFITGASGSGKSSFAQAGLVPAIETFYDGLNVKRAVLRPGADPLAALNDALWRQLQLSLVPGVSADGTGLKPEGIFRNTPQSQINVLVLDQFEEFFTQSSATGRDALFAFLTSLAPFLQTHMHIISTMRSDYLPELFNHPALYEIAKRGVDLRAMNENELQSAIQQPLRAQYPDGTKRFEPELVEQLASDAAQEASYLPLLQVTLEEIWRKGFLTRSAYTNLADALEERADQVLQFRDYDAANPSQPRTPDEQNALLDILLNLVDVSLDDDARRDVRKQRTKQELAHGDATRTQLIDALAGARLLSIENQERVDLIHESLLRDWDRLHAAIQARRRDLRERARFEQNLDEWLTQNRADEYLLDGVRLAEARELEARDDIALQSNDAKAFLRASNAKAEAEQQRELERERQRAAALDQARIEADKRTASEKQRTRILRFAAVGLGALLLVAVVAIIFAFAQNRSSDARRLAAQAIALRENRFDLSLLLAASAQGREANAEVQQTINDLLSTPTHFDSLIEYHDNVAPEISPNGNLVALASCGARNHDQECIKGEIAFWDTETRRLSGTPIAAYQRSIGALVFSPDGKTLVSAGCSELGTAPSDCVQSEVSFWDTSTHQRLGSSIMPFPGAAYYNLLYNLAYSPDARFVAYGGCSKYTQDNRNCLEGQVVLLDAATHQEIRTLTGPAETIDRIAFTPQSDVIAASSCAAHDETQIRCTQAQVYLWNVSTGQPIDAPLQSQTAEIVSLAFRPDTKQLVAASYGGTVLVWDMASQQLLSRWSSGDPYIGMVELSPDGKIAATASNLTVDHGTLAFWDLETHQTIGDPIGDQKVYGLSFTFDGAKLVQGGTCHAPNCKTGEAILWNVQPQARVQQLTGTGVTAPALQLAPIAALSADGKLIASAIGNGVLLWDAAKRQQVGQPLVQHTRAVTALAFSPDSRLVASGSQDNSILLWDTRTQKPIGKPLADFPDVVESVTFRPDGKWLAASGCGKRERDVAGCFEGSIYLWDVSTQQLVGPPLSDGKEIVYAVTFSPDGKLIASGSCTTPSEVDRCTQGKIRLWDASTHQPVGMAMAAHTAFVTQLAFSPDGKVLASGGGKEIYIWDVATQEPIGAPLVQVGTGITGIAFSRDGNWIATGSRDGALSIWNVFTRKQIVRFPAQSNVGSVAFSPDGRLLVSGGPILWDTNIELWGNPTCFVANRNLSRQEWLQYINAIPYTYELLYARSPTCPAVPVEP